MQVQGADKARREIQSVADKAKQVDRALDGVRTSGVAAANGIKNTGVAIKNQMDVAQREILQTSEHLKRLNLQSAKTFGTGQIIPRGGIGLVPVRGGGSRDTIQPNKIAEAAKSMGLLSLAAERLNIPVGLLGGASKAAIAPLMGVVGALGAAGLAGVGAGLLAVVGPLIIAFEAAKKVFDVFGKAWSNIWTNLIKPVLDGLMKELEPVFSTLQTAFEDLFTVFGTLIIETMPAMVPVLNATILAMAGFIEFLATAAKTIVKIYESTPFGFVQGKIRGSKFSDDIEEAEKAVANARAKAEKESGERWIAKERARLEAAINGDTNWEDAGEKMAKGAKKSQRPKTSYDAQRLLDGGLGWQH